MNKKEKAAAIQEILNTLYPEQAIPLNHQDPYTLLIAVLLSAQCTDERVNKVTPSLFALANTPAQMVKLGQETIEQIIRPCGLAPAKSKHIERLSQILVEKFDGMVPHGWEDLEALPGVGHKTAGVVKCQAFHEPAFPIDTHIHRLAARWRLSDGTNVGTTERDLKKLFAEETWCKVHLQIIYYGREYCQARGHIIEKCPICTLVLQKSKRHT